MNEEIYIIIFTTIGLLCVFGIGGYFAYKKGIFKCC